MADGFRDTVTDNIDELLGGSNASAFNMAGPRNKRRKRKAKKSRRMGRRTHSRKRKVKYHARKHKTHSRKSKRKGMSPAFLKNLRRKHGLGEFKKR